MIEIDLVTGLNPEGTGIEVERSAKYGIVKVNKNGDAMLVSLSP